MAVGCTLGTGPFPAVRMPALAMFSWSLAGHAFALPPWLVEHARSADLPSAHPLYRALLASVASEAQPVYWPEGWEA